MEDDKNCVSDRRKKHGRGKQKGMTTGPKRDEVTPVDRAFYESIILHDRWNVGKLYANNIFDGQNYRKEVKNMAQERANELFGVDQEIEELRKRIDTIIIQKDNLKYLPIEREITTNRRLENERNKRGIRVIPDRRNQSVIILPPIYKTIPGRKQKANQKSVKNKGKSKKQPLHLPKNKKTFPVETPRRHRFKDEYNNDTASAMTSAPTSVVTSYPDSVRTYYPSKESSSSFRDSPFKYGELYGKSSFQMINDNKPTSNNATTGNRRSNYNKNFYNEKDFKSTRPKYIPRSMRTSHEYGVSFLT